METLTVEEIAKIEPIIEIPAIDVTEYVEDYCELNDCLFEDLPFDELSLIFEGTDLEDEVKKNEEW